MTFIILHSALFNIFLFLQWMDKLYCINEYRRFSTCIHSFYELLQKVTELCESQILFFALFLCSKFYDANTKVFSLLTDAIHFLNIFIINKNYENQILFLISTSLLWISNTAIINKQRKIFWCYIKRNLR